MGKEERGEYYSYPSLVMKFRYFENNEFVDIHIDSELLPDFLALAKGYTKYLVEVAFNASTTYTIQMYLFACQWVKLGTKPVMISEIRDRLNLGDKYTQSYDLRRRILEPTSKELKEKADVWFTVDFDKPIKKGRAIIG